MVYDYIPSSTTLYKKYFEKTNPFTRVDSQILWDFITQISSAIHKIHSQNLAARCIHPTKIIVTESSRYRINGCGILDLFGFEAQVDLKLLQVILFKNSKMI